MENTVKKVYLVWYDNELPYEEYRVYLYKVFAREEDAKVYVEQENEKNKVFVPSMTKEEFYSQDPEDITCDYEQFYNYEEYEWYQWRSGKHYYTAEDVNESL